MEQAQTLGMNPCYLTRMERLARKQLVYSLENNIEFIEARERKIGSSVFHNFLLIITIISVTIIINSYYHLFEFYMYLCRHIFECISYPVNEHFK